MPLGAALQKETFIYSQAMELSIKDVYRYSNEFTVIKLDRFDSKCREHCGSGLLYHIQVESLKEIADYVTDKDQTLTYYGIAEEEIAAFVKTLNGKGLDRIVPVGRALSFDYLWDGYNLLLELTKSVQVL